MDWFEATCSESLEEQTDWIEHGEAIALTLRGALHGELDRDDVAKSYRQIDEWQRHGRELEFAAIAAGRPPIKIWLAGD